MRFFIKNMDEQTKQQIKQVQKELLERHPDWPMEKARWIAAMGLFR